MNRVKKWKSMIRASKAADEEAAARAAGLRLFVVAHLKSEPLTPETIGALRVVLAEGRPLCCEAGKLELLDFVDEIWAETLNDWAYEALSCRRSDRDEMIRDNLAAFDRRFRHGWWKP